VDKDRKAEVIAANRLSDSDTGSVDVQVAVLTERINELTRHLQTHRKDTSTRVGLLKLVSRRRKLLSYLTRHDVAHYRTLIGRLGLRK
jgi:small subunit ribosomal protein S15